MMSKPDQRHAEHPRAAPIPSRWQPCVHCGDARAQLISNVKAKKPAAEQHCGMCGDDGEFMLKILCCVQVVWEKNGPRYFGGKSEHPEVSE